MASAGADRSFLSGALGLVSLDFFFSVIYAYILMTFNPHAYIKEFTPQFSYNFETLKGQDNRTITAQNKIILSSSAFSGIEIK